MKSNTVYILGAGASRFAGFPVASGLRAALQEWAVSRRIYCIAIKHGGEAHESGVHCLEIIDRVADGLAISPPDIELILTLIDLLSLSKNGLQKNLGLLGYDLSQASRVFAQLITDTFQEKSTQAARHIYETAPCGQCDRNQQVMKAWTDCIQPGDVIISFNWEVLHEMILWRASKWHYLHGYGLNIADSPDEWSLMKIIKLHGSCNWSMRHICDPNPQLDRLEEFFPDGYRWGQRTEPGPGATADYGDSIILPSYLKSPLDKPALIPLWLQAAEAVTNAGKIVVLGYSLPNADAPTRTMISLALNKNHSLHRLHIVLGNDADDSGYRHWHELCSALGKTAQPIYKTFEEFVLGS